MSETGYCTKCGRELVEVVERRSYFDCETGDRTDDVWLECPRFPRSWRNFWLGGMGHDSTSLTIPFMNREWR